MCGALPFFHSTIRTIERAHPAIGLGPADDVFQLIEDRLADVDQEIETAPVHAGKEQRALGNRRVDAGQDLAEERAELGVRHFAGGHREFAMLDKSTDVVRNFDVIGRIGKDHLSLLAVEQAAVDVGRAGIAADQAMAP